MLYILPQAGLWPVPRHMQDSEPYTDGSEISPVGLHPGHVWWNNMRDVAVKVQAAHTTERYFGGVGTTTEPRPGGDPRDRV